MFNKLYDFNVTGFQAIPSPVGLAYALRHVYNYEPEPEDEKKLMEIEIEYYEEQDDNNDCSN